jgi:hypothetical protein
MRHVSGDARPLPGHVENTMKNAIRRTAALTFIALFLGACDKTPDEEQIAQNVTAMKEAVERKEFSDIRDHLHASFIANDRLNARDVNRLLQMYGARHKTIGATIVSSKTTLDPTFPDRAQTILSVVLTGSSGRLPSDGSVRTVTLEWVKHSGDWLVRKAEWQHY